VTLLSELDAFFTDHRLCSELDAGVDGSIVWIACDCGARLARRVDEGDALAFDGSPALPFPTWTAVGFC
jgi:hypothetical protein